jgi:hypothetical protein
MTTEQGARAREDPDQVQCRICHRWLSLITSQHLRTHNSTVALYRRQYPDAPLEHPRHKARRIAAVRKSPSFD